MMNEKEIKEKAKRLYFKSNSRDKKDDFIKEYVDIFFETKRGKKTKEEKEVIDFLNLKFDVWKTIFDNELKFTKELFKNQLNGLITGHIKSKEVVKLLLKDYELSDFLIDFLLEKIQEYRTDTKIVDKKDSHLVKESKENNL